MKAWMPIDVAAWPEVVALLSASGGQWPEWAAVADLRWHVDQGRTIPGRPTLRARWGGWTDWSVRSLLADTDRWWDPSKGVPPAPLQRPPAVLQRPPAAPQSNADNPSDSASAPPAAASTPPAALHRRDDLTSTSTDTSTSDRASTARATPHEVVPASPAVGGGSSPAGEALAAPECGPTKSSQPPGGSSQPRTLQRGTEPAGGEVPASVMAGSCSLLVVAAELARSSNPLLGGLDGRTVGQLRRLEAGGVDAADLRAVWSWASESADDDAAWLRERGLVRWSTLSAPDRWPHRLGQARAWLGRGKRSAPETRARGKPADQPTSSIAGLLDRLSANHETIDVEVTSAKPEDHRSRVRALSGPGNP